MNKEKVKIFSVILIVLSMASINMFTWAHSGRTDSSGEHRDNKNKSGLGSYHYHCGGHPAHLHSNGVCPYSMSSTSSSNTAKKNDNNKTSSTSESSNNSASSASKNSKNSADNTTKDIPNIIKAESIEIVEKIKNLKVGEVKQLAVNILPDNTTNKKVAWKSSNEDVIKVSENGKITALGAGQAYVTVSTSNKKTDSIAILVNEDKKENIDVSGDVKYGENKTEQNNQDVDDNQDSPNDSIESKSASNNTSKNSDALAGFVLLSALGAGYISDKKHRK